MQEFVMSFMNHFGYFGVFLLIAIENIFPPIPSEVILLFGGFVTTYTKLNIILMTLFATLGSLVGAILLYYIGKIFNYEKLQKLVSGKIGRILHLKKDDITRADKWFNQKGNITVFFCRFIPLVRSFISIPAGMNKMNIVKFIIYTTIGSLIWNFVLILLGAKTKENWTSILKLLNTYSIFIVIILLLLLILITIYFYKKRK